MRIETTTSKAIDRIFQLWPAWALLATGIMGYFKMQYSVEQLQKAQEKWQNSSEQRRDKNREELDDIKNRLTKVETLIHVIRKEE